MRSPLSRSPLSSPFLSLLPSLSSLSSLVLLPVLASACDGCAPVVDDTKLTPLDRVPVAGEVVCGPVARESELIGGPGAFAVVGRGFRCNNSKIRFIVQDGSRPVANSVRGGDLIDVDLQRPDRAAGAPGEDTFRELVSAVGAREIQPDKIEVLQVGGQGKDGIIRVTGKPADLSLAPQAVLLAADLQGTLVTDYVLHPDADYIEVLTTFKNEGPPMASVQPADFVAFGGSTVPHTPEGGYGELDTFTDVSFLSSTRGDAVSYAVLCGDAVRLIVPFIDQGITAPFCGPGLPVGSERTFARYLIVGDGSLESTTKTAMALAALPAGTVRGVVRDADGAPIAGAWVAALDRPLADDGAVVKNEARSAADGSFRLTLPPGSYRLLAHGLGRPYSAEVDAEVAADAEVDAGELSMPAPGRIVVDTTFTGVDGAPEGAGGELRPAKLTLVARGDTAGPSRALGEFREAGASTYQVSSDGRFSVTVPPGDYTLYVTRGFEYDRFQQDVTVGATEQVVHATLVHSVDTTGLIAAEFHQHSLGSIDSQVPIPTKVLENAAEGIELAASTDHDVITDFQPYVDQLGLKNHLTVVQGAEVSYISIGHFNAFPWDTREKHEDDGARMWFGKTVPQMFADIRAAAGDPILQINHPRANVAGYFAALLLNPIDATRLPRDPPGLPSLPPTVYQDWAGDFDCIEVNTNLGSAELYTPEGRADLDNLVRNDSVNVPVLADYLALLGAGMKVIATGNSDTHRKAEGVGYPRNFLDIGKDAPSTVTPEEMKTALRTQHNLVGEGCLLELLVDGARKSGVADMAGVDDPLRVRLQAPRHVTPGVLEVYVNGQARKHVDTDGAVALDDVAGALSVTLAPSSDEAGERFVGALTGLPSDEGDLVVVVVSKGGTGLAPTGGGGATCYSAPVYVDVDGDGAFHGWLEDTEQVRP